MFKSLSPGQKVEFEDDQTEWLYSRSMTAPMFVRMCLDPESTVGPKTNLCKRCNGLRLIAKSADDGVDHKSRMARKRVATGKREGRRFGSQASFFSSPASGLLTHLYK